LGAGIGYIFDNFRIEGKISYQDNDIDRATTKSVTLNGVDQGLSGPEMINGSLSILTFMANGYFDFNNDSNFTPYLTAGMGMANVEIDGTSTDDTVFAYQIGAGVGYALSETVSIDFGYRYLGTTDYEYAGTVLSVPIKAEDSIGSHNFTLGMRFAF
jgi:opacity protein-like surface antigen